MPKDPGSAVVILRGPHKNNRGNLMSKDKDNATVQTADLDIVVVPLDDLAAEVGL